MKYTDNLKLKKPEYTDVVDISVISENFDTIDSTVTSNLNTVQTSIASNLSAIQQSQNPNLITDGGFQVWHDGDEFSTTSLNTVNYTASVWFATRYYSSSSVKVKKLSNGIEVDATASSNKVWIAQALDEEKTAFLRGKTVTLSLYTNTYGGTYHSIKYGSTPGSFSSGTEIATWYATAGLSTKTITIPANIPDNQYITIYLGTNGSSKSQYEYIKLELGETSTSYIKESYGDAIDNVAPYLEQSWEGEWKAGEENNIGYRWLNISATDIVSFKKRKRIVPTLTIYDPTNKDEGTQMIDLSYAEPIIDIIYVEEKGFVTDQAISTGSAGRYKRSYHWKADARIY